MKKNSLYTMLIVMLYLVSCHKKKLTEVQVEVPLPSKEIITTEMGTPDEVEADEGAFQLYKLPYKYTDFSPSIDAITMEVHYAKHYLGYTNKLNKILVGTETENAPIADLLKKLNMNDAEMRNNLGGYYNHTLYFEIISPKGGKPTDTLAKAIDTTFGSFDNFKEAFTTKAENQFGSGWAWLIVDKAGKLQITTSNNQDNPMMPAQPISGKPILCVDLWEHAYYLSYQNKKRKYIDAFFNIINWKKVQEKYEESIKK